MELTCGTGCFKCQPVGCCEREGSEILSDHEMMALPSEARRFRSKTMTMGTQTNERRIGITQQNNMIRLKPKR